MKEILIGAAWIALLLWRVKRAKENAAELSAAGVLRAPLYWIGNALAFSALGLAMHMAAQGPSGIDRRLLLTAAGLFVAAIVARLLLRRRYFI